MKDLKTYSTFPKYLLPDLEKLHSYMAKTLLYKLQKEKEGHAKWKKAYENYMAELLERYEGKHEGDYIKRLKRVSLRNFFWLGMWLEEVRVICESPNLDEDGIPWNDEVMN